MNRNQLCSCGSGKRYKHCHGVAAMAPDAVPVPPRIDRLTALHLALAEQKDGRLGAAEKLYEQALAGLPGHFDALHMLGVVKLQLGKFEEGTRRLVSGLPLAPEEVVAPFKHNLSLCLLGLARQRGLLDVLTADPAAPVPATPFVRAHALPLPHAALPARVSVIVTGVTSAAALRRSLAGVRAQTHAAAEVVVAADARTAERDAMRAALAECGAPWRWVDVDAAAPSAGQADIAAAAGEGAYLAFLRAGDHWAPQWLQRMTAALYAFGVEWGYSGLRVVADDGTIVRFGASPEQDALLRAQDGLYVHRTASLGFLSFNPIAAGRNLIVTRALWRRHGGLPAGAADPFLDWGWRVARDDEPAYVDEPDYLIAPGTERLHLHDAFAAIVARTTRPLRADREATWGDTANPHLRHGIALFWARQWRQMRALQASALPAEVLLGCAAMLGIGADGTAVAPRGAG